MFEKIFLRIKQYGIYASLKRYILYKTIGIVYKQYDNIILVAPNHKELIEDKEVKLLDDFKLKDWKISGAINNSEFYRYKNFLTNNCIGYYIEIKNELAALGFVQLEGSYKYGVFSYTLPKDVNMFKNLFVKPKFRGMSLGKRINKARINRIPNGKLPCGFVIPENRYAIRNLKSIGFEEYIKVSHITFFNKWKFRKFKIIKSGVITEVLLRGFND